MKAAPSFIAWPGRKPDCWPLRPGDLPPGRALQPGSPLADLENNAPFRLFVAMRRNARRKADFWLLFGFFFLQAYLIGVAFFMQRNVPQASLDALVQARVWPLAAFWPLFMFARAQNRCHQAIVNYNPISKQRKRAFFHVRAAELLALPIPPQEYAAAIWGAELRGADLGRDVWLIGAVAVAAVVGLLFGGRGSWAAIPAMLVVGAAGMRQLDPGPLALGRCARFMRGQRRDFEAVAGPDAAWFTFAVRAMGRFLPMFVAALPSGYFVAAGLIVAMVAPPAFDALAPLASPNAGAIALGFGALYGWAGTRGARGRLDANWTRLVEEWRLLLIGARTVYLDAPTASRRLDGPQNASA